jgi:NitT/TauT family transport system ATP-binding protein
MNVPQPHIVVRNASKTFGSGGDYVEVLRNLSFEIRHGELLTLFGPNGCGKTTLLNIIGGIETIDCGEVRINSAGPKPRIGYVFQDYRANLMPWLTVADNIAFPLHLRGVARASRREQAVALIERFGFNLSPSARIHTLSGGQAQLTSILRALIVSPDLLILDEPFSALDYQTSLSLYEKLLLIWRTERLTMVLVSHSLDEALFLGQRTVFLTRRPTSVAGVLENPLDEMREVTQMGSAEFAVVKKEALRIFLKEASPTV